MLVQALGKEFELTTEPVNRYGNFGLYAAQKTDHLFHVDDEGNVLRYENYLGQDLEWMDPLDHSKADLGDRFEMERYVGGMGYFYRYHICKTTRKPIAYFEPDESLGRLADIAKYRIWGAVDLGDTLIISGAYGNPDRLIRKSDNMVLELTAPNGEKISDFRNLRQIEGDFWCARGKGDFFIVNVQSCKTIVFTEPDTGKRLDSFDQVQDKQGEYWVYAGETKYLVDPNKGLVLRQEPRKKPILQRAFFWVTAAVLVTVYMWFIS